MRCEPKYKWVIFFLWTSALVVGSLVFLAFSFIDPADIVITMMLDIDEAEFRVKAYIFSFSFLWLAFLAFSFLNYYFTQMMCDVDKVTE